jgi:hypothetical protein
MGPHLLDQASLISGLEGAARVRAPERGVPHRARRSCLVCPNTASSVDSRGTPPPIPLEAA